ncbi:MAG: hypothetical protein F4Y69_03230 [Chloroflexi bacterium]|nr:hypothetical protein [Chloroflexota bacterium]MYB23388.1 hypothetical protein [Chloroflexota bacterium]MYF21934.1 hypothetical protein [Chloroflexota bacterium]MYF80368.1 hypothetical protein [Chloroflexota bacterium]MYI05519.1 hypothetical protein [Chloroflexota bacterium]
MPLPRLIDLGDLREGTPLPERVLAPGIMDVAKFIGGAGFAIPIFLDPAAARDTGLDGPVIPAEYKSAFLLGYLRQLARPDGRILRLQSGFRRPDYHGNRFTIGGQVTRVDSVEGGREVNLELWLEQATGERSVRSSAVILLPH